MNDYVTPLEELLSQLRAALEVGKELSDGLHELGNKLLVYTRQGEFINQWLRSFLCSCCLAGRAYPVGEIAPHLVPAVKEDVFKSITALHSRNHPEDEPIYPHLKTLLQYDTREFFNVLALAFEEPEFQNDEGYALLSLLETLHLCCCCFYLLTFLEPTRNNVWLTSFCILWLRVLVAR